MLHGSPKMLNLARPKLEPIPITPVTSSENKIQIVQNGYQLLRWDWEFTQRKTSRISLNSDGHSIRHQFTPLDIKDCYGYRTLQQLCMSE